MQAVQQNVGPLLVYLAAAFVAAAGAQLAFVGIGEPENPYGDPVVLLLSLSVSLALVVLTALIQAVVFARMGKEIDRPLWKSAGDWEALRRYFLLWAVLNALIVVCSSMADFSLTVLDSERLSGMFFLLYVAACVVSVPLGGAIMFGGPLRVRKLGERLLPLMRQMPQTLLVLLLSGAVFFFTLSLVAGTESKPWLLPLLSVIQAYFDCVLFAAVWLICVYDRQNPEETEIDF